MLCKPAAGNGGHKMSRYSWFTVYIGVSQDGCRKILGADEGMKKDRESWRSFFVWLKERGLTGVRLSIGDKNLGMLETIPEVFPDARYQRCTVHFYRNIFSITPRKKMKDVALMLIAIHSQESKEAAREKAIQVAKKLKTMKLAKAEYSCLRKPLFRQLGNRHSECRKPA